MGRGRGRDLEAAGVGRRCFGLRATSAWLGPACRSSCPPLCSLTCVGVELEGRACEGHLQRSSAVVIADQRIGQAACGRGDGWLWSTAVISMPTTLPTNQQGASPHASRQYGGAMCTALTGATGRPWGRRAARPRSRAPRGRGSPAPSSAGPPPQPQLQVNSIGKG